MDFSMGMYIFIGFLVLFGITVIIMIYKTFSPKGRAKWMGEQIKAMQYMVDENKESLEDLGTTTGNIGVNVQKNIIDQNEEKLKDIATKKAEISKEGVEITARAIKDGFTDNDTIYCKHCRSYNRQRF
jgi:hypothetical protein